MATRVVSRRSFLRVTGLAVGSSVLAACGATPTATPQPTPTKAPVPPTAAPAAPTATKAPAAAAPTTAPAAPTAAPVAPTATKPPAAAAPTKFKEAPTLAELVKQGKLPPVEQRLPLVPRVVPVTEKIGKYGGDLRMGIVGQDFFNLSRFCSHHFLVRWTPKYDGVLANVAESYSMNAESSQFTFKLRKGMKWSNGAALTADDVMFWYNDVINDKELTPSQPGWLKSAGKLVVVEKLDDFTVTFTFAGPNGLFLQQACSMGSDISTFAPSAYMKQFHKKYNPQVEDQAKAEKLANWPALYEKMRAQQTNDQVPVVGPWRLEKVHSQATTRAVAIRNPYFFEVDPEGNQLPYIERHVSTYYTDSQPCVLAALNGEFDFQERFISDPKNKPLFVENQKKGKYHLVSQYPTTVNEMNICFNMNTTDEMRRTIFRNKDFRIGMSYAIDRKEIIEIVHLSQPGAIPHQTAPRTDSHLYHKRLATQYTEYDLKKANEHLDKVLPNKDAQGRRLGPDGKPFSFIMEIDASRTTYVDALELIKPQWAKVGVEMIVKTMERSLWEERCRARNLEFHASAHRFGGGSGLEVTLDPRYFFPQNTGNSLFAKAWAFWYVDSKAKDAEEPPAAAKKQMELYSTVLVTADPKKQDALMTQILDIAADEFYSIGTVQEPNFFCVVTDRLKNVPETMPNSSQYGTPNPTEPAQYFIDE